MNPQESDIEERGGAVDSSTKDNSTSSSNTATENMKRTAAAKQIERYYFQLTEGCGQEQCSNKYCASSSDFIYTGITSPNELAVKAIDLLKNHAPVCDGQPSKVAKCDPSPSQGSTSVVVATTSRAAESSTVTCASPPGPCSSSVDAHTESSDTVSVDSTQSEPLPSSSTQLISPPLNTASSSSGASFANVSLSDLLEDNKPILQDTPPSSSAQLKASLPVKKEVPKLTESGLHQIIETCRESDSWSLLIRTIGSVFNNPDSLMQSFRKTPSKEEISSQGKDLDKDQDSVEPSTSDGSLEHSYTVVLKEDEVTVDIDSVRRAFKELFEIPDEPFLAALNTAINYLSGTMEMELKYHRPYERDPNYLNIVLIVMELNTASIEPSLPTFCKAVGYFPMDAQAKLARIWADYPIEWIKQMMNSLHQIIAVKCMTTEWSRGFTVNDEPGLTGVAKVMKILYYASVFGGRMDPIEVLESEKQQSKEVEDNLNELLQGAMGHEKEKSTPKEDPLGQALGVNPLDCREPLLPYIDFVNEPLSETVDMEKDYTYYRSDARTDKFTFMTHSFLLTTAMKNQALYNDNRIRMATERRTSVFQSLLHGGISTPYLRLRIRRDHIIDDALLALDMAAMDNPQDLKKQLYVEFEGEQGIDEGGVSKEFFQLVVEEIFNPDIGMFTSDEETRNFWFNPTSFENDGQFMLIGIVLGLAIYNNVILDVHFPKVVYRKLMGKLGVFEDLVDSHPTLAKNLQAMLEHDPDEVEDTFMHTFKIGYTDVFGSNLTYDLKENGGDIPVTGENRQEFVDLYADFLLNKSVEKQFKAFLRGFHMVTDESPLKMLFHPEEIELLVCGSKVVDFNELEQAAKYDGGFDDKSPTIRNFWSICHALPEDEKRQLLQFATGSDRVPIGGLSKLKLIIARNGPDSDRLPTSHTCFNVLLLPDYTTKDKLKERLLKAIKYAKGFGML